MKCIMNLNSKVNNKLRLQSSTSFEGALVFDELFSSAVMTVVRMLFVVFRSAGRRDLSFSVCVAAANRAVSVPLSAKICSVVVLAEKNSST